MKAILKIIALCGIIVLTAFSCEKNSDESDKDDYMSGRIIKITCGGTVVQFIDTSQTIGETWNNYFVTPIVNYSNCVLVGNLSSGECSEEDTLYFNYRKVDSFTIGGPWCDIGGLPKTKIEITDLFNSKNFINEK